MPLLIVWGCLLVAIPDLLDWVRGRPSVLAPVLVFVAFGYLLFAFAVTVLGVELDDETVAITTNLRTVRIPRQAIASVAAVRSGNKLKSIRLRDEQKRPLGTIPIVRGSRQIDRADQLLAELKTIADANAADAAHP